MNVVLVGAGPQGRRRALALGQDDRLVAVADIDPEAAQRLGREFGCPASAHWEEVVRRRDAEVVLVCTPPHLHAPVSIAALGGGKHVLCEKPLARNPEEAEAVVGAVKRRGVKLKCGFNHRYYPGIRQAKAWCEQGVIGEIMFLRCRHGIGGRPGYEKEWRAQPELSGGGELMDQGLHSLDLLRWWLGGFTEVFGLLSSSFWNIAPLEDNAFVLLRTAKGQVASLHVSWTQWKNLFSFEIFGREGYIEVSGLGGSYGAHKAIRGKNAPLAPFLEEVIEYRGGDQSFREEWQEFTAAIQHDGDHLASSNDGLEALRLAAAVYESARAGCVVRLENSL